MPGDYVGSIFVVIHVSADAPGILAELLQPHSRLPVAQARDGERIVPGRVFVAAPDRHLVLEAGRVRSVYGPKENRHRPSIDVSMRSAAQEFGPRAVGVVLTGNLDDGSRGLDEIKRSAGTAIVQDPVDAAFPEMPRNALRGAAVDFVLPAGEIGEKLVELSTTEAAAIAPPPDPARIAQIRAARFAPSAIGDAAFRPGEPSPFSCPDCHGTLWESREGAFGHFRCRVGHAFSPESLAAAQTESVDHALWIALRALEEKAALSTKLAREAADRHLRSIEQIHRTKAGEVEKEAEVIREVLLDIQRREVAEPADRLVHETASGQ